MFLNADIVVKAVMIGARLRFARNLDGVASPKNRRTQRQRRGSHVAGSRCWKGGGSLRDAVRRFAKTDRDAVAQLVLFHGRGRAELSEGRQSDDGFKERVAFGGLESAWKAAMTRQVFARLSGILANDRGQQPPFVGPVSARSGAS